ncbi:glycosyl hydrolase, family 88 [Alkaliphilus metalliredigens QYMF]|uniref:Glycosyl hydrolase, family 88 n=1 Tax=Alkaliphilus metalliredigens (strain QYMF) TaxID=293826 RepID=A6TLP9_ALKMQ|nr:glycoside hydrolase family 88 protein [Alkaliphilus metalliredigens]ABR47117.1 glycosyl hydrolase, family 88 [Alkaliphilus metalliredigens QYMF]
MKTNDFIKVYLEGYSKYKEKWNYEDGCVYKGALDLYKATNDKEYLNFVKAFIDESISESGEILRYEIEEFNIDNINTGKVLFDLYEMTRESKYKKAAMQLREQLQKHPKTEEGSFWHKKIYPNQVWLDGLYMAMPFYAEYEKLFNKSQGFEDIHKQFMVVRDRVKDLESGLYYHGYDESKKERWSHPETGLSQNFWSRAMGWFVMAMVDTLEVIGEGTPYFLGIQEMLKESIDALLKYQDKQTFMWYQVIDQIHGEGNYLETSGTLMIAYGILKGVRLGFLPEEYQSFGKKAFTGVIEKYLDTNTNHLGGICGVAGLGNTPYRDGSYEYYMSEKIIENDPKGVGAFLMTYSEMLRS